MTGRNPFSQPKSDSEKDAAIVKLGEHCTALLEFIETLANSRDLSLGKQHLETCELWIRKSINFYGVKK